MLMQQIQQMNQPSESERMLQSRAANTMNWLDSRDYRNLPTGTFIDFSTPAENMKRYETLMNASQNGTNAIGSDGGAAGKLQQKFMQDRFARDDAANFQQNVQRMAGEATNVLGSTAGMEMQRRMGAMNAVGGAYGQLASQPRQSLWGSILGAGATIGAAAIKKW